MEINASVGVLMICGVLGWIAAYVVVVVGSSRSLLSRETQLRLMGRSCMHLCERISRTRVVQLLLEVPAWSDAAATLAAAFEPQSYLLSRGQACAALLLGDMVLACICALFSRSLVGGLVPILALYIGIPLWSSSKSRRKAQQLSKEMPEALRALAQALTSGETLAQAIEYVGAHGNGLVPHAFSRVAMRLRCGDSTREALEQLSVELDAPRVGLLVTALLISQRTGSPLRGLLQTSAELAERQGEMERLLAVKTAQVRLSVRIVCLLPLVMVGTLSLISQDFQAGVRTPAGAGCVAVALGMDGLALLIVRRLMKGVV